jgi:hypothetical protein
MLDSPNPEANCALCRDLDPAERAAMRANLIVIPLHEIDHICEPCMEAFTANPVGRGRCRMLEMKETPVPTNRGFSLMATQLCASGTSP